jgi:hypothetical protein
MFFGSVVGESPLFLLFFIVIRKTSLLTVEEAAIRSGSVARRTPHTAETHPPHALIPKRQTNHRPQSLVQFCDNKRISRSFLLGRFRYESTSFLRLKCT